MEQQLRDKINRFEHFLMQNQSPIHRQHDLQNALETNLHWASSLYFAQLVHLSTPLFDRSRSWFNNFLSDYIETGRSPDVQWLFDKLWLREVLGEIHLPGILSWTCFHFEKIRPHKQELMCLFTLYKRQKMLDKPISGADFEQLLTSYEKEHSVHLNREVLKSAEWYRGTKKGSVCLENLNHHFSKNLKYWDELEFLTELKDHLPDSHILVLPISDFQQHHKRFASFYSKTPSIEVFKEQGWLSVKENEIHINLENSSVNYLPALKDSIFAHYWEILTEDKSSWTKTTRVQHFMKQASHWCYYSPFLSQVTQAAKKSFLDGAMDLVLGEHDLIGIALESRKVLLDRRHGHQLVEEVEEFLKTKPSTQSPKDLLELSLYLKFQEDEFTFQHFEQGSRHKLKFLVWAIVRSDLATEKINDSKVTYYPRVKRLIHSSLERPSLLSWLGDYIETGRSSVIPYLLLDIELTGLGFHLLSNYEPQENKAEFLDQAWQKALELLEPTFKKQYQQSNIAKAIWQVLWVLNYHKYPIHLPSTETLNQQRERKQIAESSDQAREKLKDFALVTYHNRLEKDPLLPKIIPEIIDELQNDRLWDIRKPKTSLSLPYQQWDIVIWFLKCCQFWKNEPEIDLELENRLTKYILDSYAFSMGHIPTGDDRSAYRFNTLWIALYNTDWGYLATKLYKQSKLHYLLYPSIEFPKDRLQDSSFLDLQSDRLRLLTQLLVFIYEDLIHKRNRYRLEQAETQSLRTTLESRIFQLLSQHIQKRPDLGSIDLFEQSMETRSGWAPYQAILPRISMLLNYFQRKEEFLKLFTQTLALPKILSIAEHLTSEGLRKQLLEKITSVGVDKFLKTAFWKPDVQIVLDQMIQHGELLLPHTEKVLEKLNRSNSRIGTSEKANKIARTQLIIAYFKGDIEGLKKIQPAQKSRVKKYGEFSIQDQRTFLLALYYKKHQTDLSIRSLEDLVDRFPQYPVLMGNLIDARLTKVGDDGRLEDYQIIFQEWENYQKLAPEFEIAEFKFLQNQLLRLYFSLGDHDEFDSFYLSLDYFDQMDIDNATIYLKNLLQRDKKSDAFHLLKQIEEFHQYTHDEGLKRLNSLEKMVYQQDGISELQRHYDQIYRMPADKLIQIFPKAQNGKFDLHPFIVQEYVLACKRMLVKIQSVHQLPTEDRYNDLVDLTLNSRFSSWGWTVHSQPPGGFSGADKPLPKRNPGERDFTIQASNGSEISVCEALIFSSAQHSRTHLNKILNYSTDRKNLIILIYNTQNKNFEKDWQRYLNVHLKNNTFSKRYSLLEHSEVTEEFLDASDTIRVAHSKHENQLSLYHIMVNIHYGIGIEGTSHI